MRFWWCLCDWALGLGLALLGLLVVAAATTPGPEVRNAATRVQRGMTRPQVIGVLDGPGEEDRMGFRFSAACGPRPWGFVWTRDAYRGPLTTVQVTYKEYIDGRGRTEATVETVRVEPTFLLLENDWFVGAAGFFLAAAKLSGWRRRRGGRLPVAGTLTTGGPGDRPLHVAADRTAEPEQIDGTASQARSKE